MIKTITTKATKAILFCLCLISSVACNKKIDLQGFDLETWKADTKGCNNQRLKLLADFEQKIKPQLKGMSENQLATFLGKADQQELSKRNQKFYYYFIEAGKHCGNTQHTITARRLQIRFDAINNVSEIVMVYD
jgi:hypothetical protein